MKMADERKVSFDETLNSALAGLAVESPTARLFEVKARPLGTRPGVDLSRALRLADQLEDEAVVHKFAAQEVRDRDQLSP